MFCSGLRFTTATDSSQMASGADVNVSLQPLLAEELCLRVSTNQENSLVRGRAHKVQQGGSSFEWGWQQGPQGVATVGQYYVKLPQSEQRVNYAADANGYHGALAVNTSDHQHTHSATFTRAWEVNKLQVIEKTIT
ncbi:unnamed protein product [Diatraea saccharalis]|uniref:Uncharacterized protein n=1 Tax=Diatraea saccharalis TaxID=40085 RepID=A0A9N9R618_9NEOP|nr:unnamed protein product [Diatraea saccharalis]